MRSLPQRSGVDFAYGGTRYDAGGQMTLYRYTGQRVETGAGLYDYGARWYEEDFWAGLFLLVTLCFADPLNVVVIVKTNLQTQAQALVILFSSDLDLTYDLLIDYYSLRFQIEFRLWRPRCQAVLGSRRLHEHQ